MARNLDTDSAGPRTLAIHAGERPDPATGASSPNIVMSSTFVTERPEGFSARELTEDSPFVYTRWANPTVRGLEEKVAALEGAESAAAFASGMAAAHAILLAELSSGDRLVLSDVSYAGIAELARDTLPRMGVEVVTVNMSDLAAVEAAVTKGTRLVFIDTPCNPLMRLTDIAAVARIAHAAGARLAIDSTFASPVATRPLEFGADYVMHSATKYLGGHGDAVGGVVCGRAELIRPLVSEAIVHFGGVMSPFNAWLIARGAATLPIRMRAHEETAMAVAKWLEADPRIARVVYPGLPSHPQHDLARRQMRNFSGMMTFRVRGGEAEGAEAAARMAARLKVIHHAVSLGHHRTLVCWMPTASLLETSFRLTGAGADAYRDWAGEGVFRLSIGLEDAADLIRDLDAVL
ncbi:PLP-dependent aspartate aminotransferase family protein [Limibaculum sp. FT325]|uniref:trans-sulfuration enzyme family protein n=1 Tax=Thermohalobaculum sediminis TaxID=2939436 RepID=UPI0020BEF64E|nr:PLP-dependent aspartate aminotransferase family protein [Limibaculum sediminis]MCL5778168.1 PLP-dependent aspartate aminotransferase family protein [Limibaculum sediminis]